MALTRGKLDCRCWLLAGFLVWTSVTSTSGQELTINTASQKPLILAHYMPWYEAPPASPRWGWHWTMNHFDPEQRTGEQRQIASHYYPLIGPYDSGDVSVIEFHLLTMKLAGIDGVIVDWYGLTDYRDYALLHRNTTRVLQQAERLGMKFVICYEDQTIPALVEGQRILATDRVAHAANEISWLGKYWFKSGSYVKVDGRPLLLSFGQTGLTDAEWSQCLDQVETKVTYLSQHHRRTAAMGAFDWPVPAEPKGAWERFQKESSTWPIAIPVAFPRFVDIYAEAKVGPSYGRMEDDQGATFAMMLEQGLRTDAAIVQLATWNDWGEGTQIEPSLEFGYRELETVQRLRRQTVDPKFVPQPDDLRLPFTLFQERQGANLDPSDNDKSLAEIAELLAAEKLPEARAKLKVPGKIYR
ncbi:MAG: hypothetical protein JNK57_05505 [Planctomycetaceae bacterium]|nr:hypothetical protein [Planctomycetaceae bacterium]